ncbi:hypothetical protein ES702_06338 [subsurface metagenome]
MILYFRITRERKEALLSFYPGGIKQFIEKTISDTADKIIIERDLFDTDRELNEYHDRRFLNRNNIHSRKCTQATKDKISKAQKGKHTGWHQFPETKRLIGLAHRGKIVSEETREKIGLANKGKKRTEQQKRNIGLAHKGLKYKKHAKAGLN